MEEPFVSLDGTILAQKALSAIKRTDEQIGFATTIEILRGARSQKVRENKYDELKTFGVGRDVSVLDWLFFLEQMLNYGYLETDELAQKLKITEKGNDVLMGMAKMLFVPLEYEYSPEILTLYEMKGVKTPEDRNYQDLLLYKRLKGLCRSYAEHSKKSIYSILEEGTIQRLVREKPLWPSDVQKTSGVKLRQQNHFLLTLTNTIRRHFDLIDLKKENGDKDKPQRTRPQRQPRKSKTISVNKIRFEIDSDIKDSIDWSALSANIRSMIRWNLWKDTIISLKQLIPEETNKRDSVVKRFVEILREGYNLQVKGEAVLIPQRIEVDCNGKPVHTLLRESFEDGVNQYVAFVETNLRYPHTVSDEYESSLLRWHQEIKRGIIPLSEEQMKNFNTMEEKLAASLKSKQEDKYDYIDI